MELRLALLAGALALTLACVGATPSATPLPRATAIRLPTPTARVTPTPYPSGGLGLRRDEWEDRRGPPGRSPGRLTIYDRGRYGVAFAADTVWYIERTWGERSPVALELAREEGRGLAPADAEHLDSLETRLRKFDLYRSASLADRFRQVGRAGGAVNPWLGREPGTFIVFYREQRGQVTELVVTTGDNP